MAERLVYLTHLAAELGYTKAAFHRVVRRAGIEPRQVPSDFSRGQRTLAITAEEADRLRATGRGSKLGTTERVSRDPDEGVFYALVLDAIRPGRVKLGFTSDLEQRLANYRTSSPEVQVLFAIPCRRGWEATTMAALTNVDECRQVGQEVFDYANLDVLADRACSWFAMLPEISAG
jgi:hypothetical protein